jgi:hypothetical protein
MIDECDTFLSGNDELRGVLNAGHRRGQYCIRCVGEDNDPVAFDPFGAKCLAMIGRFPDTLADRSLLIHIRRRSPEESLERVRLDRLDADMEPLSRKCARWVEDHFDELKAADPEVPNELNDRARDNWRVLLSIADAVGGAWPAKAREAATLTSDQDDDERSAKSMLLEDFRRLFDERNVDQLASADVVEALVLMEERPWPEWYRGNPITARGVAKLLRDYKIKPRQLWIDGNKTRGYSRDAFEDTWRHYLDSGGSTGRTIANTEPEPNSVPVEEDEPTDPENAEDPRQQGILPDIPDGNPSTGRGA